MDKYNFFKQGGVCPSNEQLFETKLFYRNAAEIFDRYDAWKKEDKFYFIPLFMKMTYSCSGWVAEIAKDPIWLGSYVQTVIKHPNLFIFICPMCRNNIAPYRYIGSPLSGRVDLEGICSCGWKGFETVSGWKIRAIALREQTHRDSFRYYGFRLLHPKSSSSIHELLSYLKHK